MGNSQLCLVISTAVVLSGCGRHVFVRDEAGHPVRDVSVQIIYPSFGGPQYKTDKRGDASLGKPWLVDVYGIAISKDGFDSDEYRWPERWPLVVTLHPGTGRRLGGQPFQLPSGLSAADKVVMVDLKQDSPVIAACVFKQALLRDAVAFLRQQSGWSIVLTDEVETMNDLAIDTPDLSGNRLTQVVDFIVRYLNGDQAAGLMWESTGEHEITIKKR